MNIQKPRSMMKFRHIAMPSLAACAALRRRRAALRAAVRAIQAAPDAIFVQGFPGMVAEVEAAFRHEEALLELLGDTCQRPRRAEHAIILCALHRTMSRVESGDVRLGRQVADALGHILAGPAGLMPAF